MNTVEYTKVDKEFYPTPEWLVDKMLLDVDFDFVNTILEPSAGKGNIVDGIQRKIKTKNKYNYNYESRIPDIDCVEIDENLRHILKGKGYKVVYDDFLKYNTAKEYDLIVMNPPFKGGEKHLLKALEMQKRNGGAIVCLLNAETIRNPYSNDRMELNRQLEDYAAEITYIKNAFTDAERRTDVEIALIKVKLPEVERTSFIFENLKKSRESETFQWQGNTEVAENDFFKSIVDQYNMEVEAGIRLIKEYYGMKSHMLSSFSEEAWNHNTSILHLSLNGDRNNYDEISVNAFVKAVRRKYWKALFTNDKFVGQLTGKLRSDYMSKVEELSGYDFSLFNIYELKIDMTKKVIKGVEDTIIELFEELSNKHHWFDECSKNIHYYNGWKTNKSYIVNKKVIIPLQAWSNIGYSFCRFDPTWQVKAKLKDMEKCFNYLDGGLTEAVDIDRAIESAEINEQTKNIKLKYFTVTFYKKGTCHITFTNEELLKKFNIFGAQHKGWLPPCYGKKKYAEMSNEEKSVVDDFEGEISYNKVMRNSDYYLFNTNNINLLEVGA